MTQGQALDILKTGGNVFLTGEPGAGKTYVLNQYIDWLEAAGISVAITASTGIAATHIGGMTIHAWSGIGIRDELTPYDLDAIAGKEKNVKRINRAKVLVIDEISMLDGKVLEMVDKVCRTVRQKAEPFGGLQIIMVGDFFQLPPITKRGEVMRYAFESHSWNEMQPLICYITEQYRHEDEMLSGLLGSIRRNDIDESHYTLLQEQTDIEYEDIEPTKLYTHNADVDAVNNAKLAELAGGAKRFMMEGYGAKPVVEGLKRSCLSPECLDLKEEAMVMCTKNNFEVGYVNGTLGRVVRFSTDEGYPVIQTSDGKEITIEPVSWEMREDNKIRAEIKQIPLRLAWAITVHKSQGMSLDAAEIDLSKAFVYGQGYVALSRIRTLGGLKLIGMNPNALQVDPKVIEWDARFQSESESAEDAFAEMEDDEVEQMHEQFVTAVGGKLPKPGEVKKQSAAERLQKESTLEVTKNLIQAGNTVTEVAKERDLAPNTIWGHVEKLIEEESIAEQDLSKSLPADWPEIYDLISETFKKQEDDKLKPVYEALGEEYDYELIRLARCFMRLRGTANPVTEDLPW